MRRSLSVLLAQIATIVAGTPGCSFFDRESCQGAPPVPPPKTVAVTGKAACQIVQAGPIDWSFIASDIGVCAVPVYDPTTAVPSSDPCGAACGNSRYQCTLPNDYLRAYVAAQPPALLVPAGYGTVCADGGDGADARIGAGSDSGTTGAGVCPPVSGPISVSCAAVPCSGRRTSGIETPGADDTLSPGDYFARCSYFEAGRHADLSWRVDAWAASRLDPRDNEAVRRAMKDAARELLAGDHDGLAPEGRVVTGMPSEAERLRIARRLDETLFRTQRCA
jgi:hypothetical protein